MTKRSDKDPNTAVSKKKKKGSVQSRKRPIIIQEGLTTNSDREASLDDSEQMELSKPVLIQCQE